MGLRMMTSLGGVTSTMPMMQRRTTMRFKSWQSLVFVVTLAVVSMTSTPSVAATKETDSARADRSTRDVAVAPPQPGEYKIEYTGYTFNRKFPDKFPDLDYAFWGYDSLKGFPLEVGSDPGFTRPIFLGDYTDGLRTADYLWLLPKGVAAVPDVSCVTSFSSEVVKSSRALSRSMSASAKLNGGGWGVSFSASVGYQEASAAVSSGEYVLIISKANCDYYFMKLIDDDAPPFHPAFIKWVNKLNNSNDENDFIDFFEKYGTHFVNQATFGASFTYEHKMSSSNYQTMSSSGLDVSVAASYSGAFSIGGEVGYSQAQKDAAADFNSKVTTKTITIGSPPPANGDALTWASAVKQNPLPVSYDLTSIDELFSETFMGPGSAMGTLGIDYSKIRTMIANTKRSYCKRLQSQGLVNDCSDYISALTLERTKLVGSHVSYAGINSNSDCIDLCYDLSECHAVDFCDKCSSSDSDYRMCRVYTASQVTSGSYDTKWETTIFLPVLEEPVYLENTDVNGVERALSSKDPVTDVVKCSEQCAADEFCVAFTFCTCPEMKNRCKLYSDILYTLKSNLDSTLYFVPSGLTITPQQQPVRRFTPQNSLYAGVTCSGDQDCGSTGATCQDGICLCPLKHYYSRSKDVCVTSCSSLDTSMMGPYRKAINTDFEGTWYYDMNYDDIFSFRASFPMSSAESCYTLCTQDQGCLSAYYDGSTCFLFSSLDIRNFQSDVPADARFYQRVCVS